MEQKGKGQNTKPQMKINEISAGAFGKFYRRGETTGIYQHKKYLVSDPSALRPDPSDVASALSTPCAP